MNHHSNPTRTIVIAGGGFAGTTLARCLEQRLPGGWQLMLVSEESYTTFTPMLSEVVGAGVFPEHVIVPIRELLTFTRFVMGQVRGVDTARRVIRCATLAGPVSIAYDHLVFALGQRANLNVIPGLAAHALPLRLVGDAVHIRNRILQRLARIELTPDPDERLSLGHFVVIGGGFAGVEVAGALADFIRTAQRCYPRIRTDELGVTLLHDGPRLLPEMPAALGQAAARSLHRRGVRLFLDARTARVGARSVELASGLALATDTVVCTIGLAGSPLVEALGLDAVGGRILTGPDGAIEGRPGLWAVGDCAATANALNGATCPPTAQFAVAQARQLARNLVAHIEGRPTRPFHHRPRGMAATTGHRTGVAHALGLPLGGLPAWLLWRAGYLMRMPTLARKLRLWVEWTWGLFFAADVTHVPFTRTGDADCLSEAAAPPSVIAPRRQEIVHVHR